MCKGILQLFFPEGFGFKGIDLRVFPAAPAYMGLVPGTVTQKLFQVPARAFSNIRQKGAALHAFFDIDAMPAKLYL